MARAIFGDFSPHIVKATQGPTPYSPLGGMERMLQSPVTNLAIAGISRAIKEGEADERQEEAASRRQAAIAALRGQQQGLDAREAARIGGLEIDEEMDRLAAIEGARAGVSVGPRGITEISQLSTAGRPDLAGAVGPADIVSMARHMEGQVAASMAAGLDPMADQQIGGSIRLLTDVGAADVANELLGGASARQALQASRGALQRTEEGRARSQAADVALARFEGGLAAQEEADLEAGTVDEAAQAHQQAVADIERQVAAVPQAEQLPRTFADYATRYAQAVSAGDTATATALLRSVEDATDIIPTSAMQALTGSPAAKARKALMQMGAKIGESQASAAHDKAKLDVERTKAGATVTRASAATKNATTLGSYRVARSELARAQALLAKARATKLGLDAAKMRRRAKGSKGGIKAANRLEASGVALELMAMLSSGASDTDPEAFEALRAKHDSLTGRSTVGATFITTDPSTWAQIRTSVMKREMKMADAIVKTVGDAARHDQAMARLNHADRKLDELNERRLSGGEFDIGEQASMLKVLRRLAQRGPGTDVKNEAKAALEAQIAIVLGGLEVTTRSAAADAARNLEKTAKETERAFEDVREF